MERIEKCPGSVKQSACLPDRDTPWSIEGTKAHKVLEIITDHLLFNMPHRDAVLKAVPDATPEMFRHGLDAAKFIIGIYKKLRACDGNEILVETKVILKWIHQELGGTFDGGVVEVFGTLHIFDYKFGVTLVSPVENLQMVTYGCGLAHEYNWNFHTARLWIIQPRVKGYDGPTYWDVSMPDMRDRWAPRIRRAVERAIDEPDKLVEGSWCHWCKANRASTCPLKAGVKAEKARNVWGC
jgi:hypothetical protein